MLVRGVRGLGRAAAARRGRGCFAAFGIRSVSMYTRRAVLFALTSSLSELLLMSLLYDREGTDL